MANLLELDMQRIEYWSHIQICFVNFQKIINSYLLWYKKVLKEAQVIY